MTKLFITMLLGIVVFFTVKDEALAADLQRSYYKVVSGTATKLGSEEQEKVSTNAYLEEWEVPLNCELEADVLNVLLESGNASQLPISVDKLNYSTLKELAEAVAGKELDDQSKIYQGYARLSLPEATTGYTYGILIKEDKVTGNYIVTGYYAELNQKAIYKLELICKKSNSSEIFKEIKIVTENRNDSKSSSESSTPDPEPPTPPTPPPAPPVPDDPTPPSPVIPGPTDDSTSNLQPIQPPLSAPIDDEPTLPSDIIPGATEE